MKKQLHNTIILWVVILFLPTICLGAVRLGRVLVAIEVVLFLYWLVRRLISRWK